MMRVIVNGVSFYTTESRVKNGVGSSVSVNAAVRVAYELLGKSTGIGTRVPVYDHQMVKQYFDVQIDRL